MSTPTDPMLFAGRPITEVAQELSDMYRPAHWWQLAEWWKWKRHRQPEHVVAAIRLALTGEAPPEQNYGRVVSVVDTTKENG